MPACARCGEQNPEGMALCRACGTSLPPEPSGAQVRKTVTVLFSDVCGSTQLAEQLDPELLREVMSRYFEGMRAVLERHSGTVEKFIGDAIMAVFGIPVAHEDDGLRAVRAARDMREALAHLNEQLQSERGITISTRTGVNTGEVVTGDPTTGQPLVTGEAVNVAARLEQAARPGDILLGEASYRLVRNAITARSVGRLPVKGKEYPVVAYLLIDIRREAEPEKGRLQSPLVGRDRQLSLLAHAFESTVMDRACHLFTVLGVAGIGKSRLVEEFLSRVKHQPMVLRGRCLAYGEGITYWPIAEAIRRAGRIEDAMSRDEARRRIDVLLDDDLEGPEIADRLAHVVGLSDTGGVPEETFWAVRRLLENLAHLRPTIAVFDDIQWAEPSFLDLLEHVADISRDAPILLVCLARPELLDRRPGWGGGKLNATSILLEPLGDPECTDLLRNLLGAEPSEGGGSRITEMAEGNPLFLEETLAMLIDDGLLVRIDDRWEPVGELSGLSLPPSVQALLSARLDQLEPDERAVIQRASVEGSVFHVGGVAELAVEMSPEQLRAHLMALTRKDLIRPAPSEFRPTEAFRFRHELIRDAAYQSLPKRSRAGLHERFAVWLERTAGERIAEHEEIVAYHLERAFRYRAELTMKGQRTDELGRRAAARLVSCAHKARDRGDVAAEANLLSRAVLLLPASDPTRLAILPDLGEALYPAGRLAEADAVLAEAIQAASDADEEEAAAHASLVRLQVRIDIDPKLTGEGVRHEVEGLIEFFEQREDERGLARAWLQSADASLYQMMYGAASILAERAVSHARRAGDRGLEVRCLLRVAGALTWGPTPADEAIRRCREVLELSEGNRWLKASVSLRIAYLRGEQGHIDYAREQAHLSRTMFEELGLKGDAETLPSDVLGYIELFCVGDPWAAEREWRRAYEFLDGIGERSRASTFAAVLADALYCQGRHQEAARFTQVSEATAASDDLASQIDLRRVRAKALARQGDHSGAHELAREAVSIAQGTECPVAQGRSLEDLAEVLQLVGRPEEAIVPVREAIAQYERKGCVLRAEAARGRLSKLVGAR